MTPLAILDALAARGVSVRVAGRALVLRPKGPTSAQLKAELKAHRSEVRALLDPDVRWRVDILLPQVPPFPAPLPHLAVRPDVRPGPGDCTCCGDALSYVPEIGVGQCDACRQAISLLVAEWSGGREDSRQASPRRLRHGHHPPRL